MLWTNYVFRRGSHVEELWDSLFETRSIRLLYIAGRGFDIRAQAVLSRLVSNLKFAGATVSSADLLLIALSGYKMDDELRQQTEENVRALESTFEQLGQCKTLSVHSTDESEEELTASSALRLRTTEVLSHLGDHTDIVLDASSMPRVAYLAILTALLEKLLPDRTSPECLGAGGVNLQVLVAEDAELDAQIRSEDPGHDPVLIPGFSSALHAESVQDWPLVWFPILGENRVPHLERVMTTSIPEFAEICPVLPHPSRDPRRADRLLIEYKGPLFDSRQTPISNILYVHESNPFETYRQLLRAMNRYRQSMSILGGCRLVVTPLGSKLVTLGAGLACFEIRPAVSAANYGVAIPYAAPTRYVVPASAFANTKPELVALLLTGTAYQ